MRAIFSDGHDAAITEFTPAPSRRGFLKLAAAGGAGLTLSLTLDAPALAAAPPGSPPINPQAFIRIATDDTVTVLIKHLEMGQGTASGLAMVVAEELDADWGQMRIAFAPANAALYNNLAFGTVQGTGGSTGMANSFMQLRQAGAAARGMLVAAAAKLWQVPGAEITVSDGVVSHGGRQARFGALADAAAREAVPEAPRLKDPKAFKLIGKEGVRRLDAPAKTDGTAPFTLDLTRPGMRIAVIARPPRFGATVQSVDAVAAKAVPGVVDIVAIPAGVAVLAENSWAALTGRDALKIAWNEEKAEKRGTAELTAAYHKLAETPGRVAARAGDVRGFDGLAKKLEMRFDVPYLAHAPMEPLDAVIEMGVGEVQIWAGSQIPTLDQFNVGRVLGLTPDKVKIHTQYAGGSFGRRAIADSDFMVEAAQIVKATGGKYPVKLMWSREDDIKGGRYRPMFHHWVRGGLDAQGRPVLWHQRLVGQSIIAGTPFAGGMIKDGIDKTSVEGAANLPYAIPNLQVELHTTEVGVPVLWWRSVGHTHTAFSTEIFVDELARLAGADPVAFRRALLADHPRHRAVLDLAADKAGWGAPLPAGMARGVALHESFGSVVAQVAEVRLVDGKPKVERVVCAIDCGIAVYPDAVRAQMEGGIVYGLSAALFGAITLKDGVVEQSNFHDYRVLRIDETPKIEVHIVPSAAPPSGVGEPGVPPIAPAVANALRQLTGKPVQQLPIIGA